MVEVGEWSCERQKENLEVRNQRSERTGWKPSEVVNKACVGREQKMPR